MSVEEAERLLQDGVMYIERVEEQGEQIKLVVREFPPPDARDTLKVGRQLWQNGSVWVVVDVTEPSTIHVRPERLMHRRVPLAERGISL